jgi:hypothetical protein
VVAFADILDDVMRGFLDTLNSGEMVSGGRRAVICGQSIARILDALGNDFRYFPEWANAKTPSAEQLRSMTPLSGCHRNDEC